MSIYLFLAIYAFVCGLVTGSYLNVLAYRLPRGLSTVLPRSRCPVCGTPIRPIDNVPILSYLWLRGRCRGCGTPISIRYPLVELLTGALFFFCFLRFGVSWATVAGAAFCASLVALAAIDIEHFLLPDRITLPGIVLGILAHPLLPSSRPYPIGLLDGLLGAVLGGGALLLLYGLWLWLRREEGLGLGDVKMLAMVGGFLGWQGALVTVFFASLAGSIVGIALLLVRGGNLKLKLPFGVFLSAGALLALFWGESLIQRYLENFSGSL